MQKFIIEYQTQLLIKIKQHLRQTVKATISLMKAVVSLKEVKTDEEKEFPTHIWEIKTYFTPTTSII